MARSEMKDYAPYVFLMEGAGGVGASEYELFVCVPHKIDEKVEVKTATLYTVGTTFVSYSITSNPGAAAGKFFQRILLNPEMEHQKAVLAAAPATIAAFDKDKFYIEVSTSRPSGFGGSESQNIRIFYGSADTYNNQPQQVAFDCPYLYLANPHAEVGGSLDGKYEYEPYCLIPLRDYEGGALLAQSINQQSGGVQGQCLQQVTLDVRAVPLNVVNTANVNGVDTNGMMGLYDEIDVVSISANAIIYEDPSSVTGWFEVIIDLQNAAAPPPTKKRKGRLGNLSSDTNPASFIDFSAQETEDVREEKHVQQA